MSNPLNMVVVEDHDALRAVTVEALSQRGHNVRGVDSAEALPEEPGLFPIDLMVIDLNLPGEDGISLAARIRAAQPDIYLTKPTSTDELVAAIRALTRRIKPDDPSGNPFTVHMAALTLQGPLGKTSLSGHEAATLAAFVRAKDQQLESWQLIAVSDSEASEPSKKTLEVQIVRLRKKLQQCGAQEPSIKAIRGQGYRLCLTVGLSTA